MKEELPAVNSAEWLSALATAFEAVNPKCCDRCASLHHLLADEMADALGDSQAARYRMRQFDREVQQGGESLQRMRSDILREL